jgi:hypothetical protein
MSERKEIEKIEETIEETTNYNIDGGAIKIDKLKEDTEADIYIDTNDAETNTTNETDTNQSMNTTTTIYTNPNNVDIEYNIDYLVNDDEKLIDVEKIKIQVDKYIDNYNSEIMKKYKNTFNKLYQKYSNKKYKIQILPLKDKYNSTKIIVTKNDKKETIVTEITKPHYLYYDEDANLYKLKNKISNERAELLYKYKLLVSQLNVSTEDKDKFEKERKDFITILEEYYTYTLYHKKINTITLNNKTNLIIQSSYFIEKEDKSTSVLSGDTYLIDNTIIENINTYNIDKLTKYNNLMLQLTGKNQKEIKQDTKLIEEIKLYLDTNQKKELMKNLEMNKKQQEEYVNYIVVRLPILI